jgi:general secretion pathway protein B
MSYILDALKKADQEREQGHVPGLHAQQTLPADAPAASGGLSPLAWAGIGMALTLAAVLTWRQWPAADVPPATPSAVQTPMPDALSQARPPAAPVVAPLAPQGNVALSVEGRPASERSSPERGSPSATRSAPDSTLPAPQGAGAPLPGLADLPEALRRDMPALSVGGAMHSPTPAQRMLVLNGQVFHEGDSPSPGLTLEEIRLKSAVLNFQGQRFLLTF